MSWVGLWPVIVAFFGYNHFLFKNVVTCIFNKIYRHFGSYHIEEQLKLKCDGQSIHSCPSLYSWHMWSIDLDKALDHMP